MMAEQTALLLSPELSKGIHSDTCIKSWKRPPEIPVTYHAQVQQSFHFSVKGGRYSVKMKRNCVERPNLWFHMNLHHRNELQ